MQFSAVLIAISIRAPHSFSCAPQFPHLCSLILPAVLPYLSSTSCAPHFPSHAPCSLSCAPLAVFPAWDRFPSSSQAVSFLVV